MTKKTKPTFRHLIEMGMLDKQAIGYLFQNAEHFLTSSLEKDALQKTLSGKVVTNLFFEPSTRSRHSFLIAAKRLGAIVINPDMSTLATAKGESLIDTIRTFEAMGTCYSS